MTGFDTDVPAAPGAVARTPRPYRELVASLSGAQKSNVGAPGYSRWVNRRLGRFLAAAAYKAGLSPNNVTAISAVFTFAAIVVLATVPLRWWCGLVVAAGLVVGYALDSADGQLARLLGGGSPAGEWLDHVVDCTKCSALHLAVVIGWYRYFDQSDKWLLVPLLYTLVSAVWFFAVVLSEQLRKAASPVATARPAAPSVERAPVLRSIVVLPADYGLLAVCFVLIGAHSVFRAVYLALLVLNALFLLVKLRDWYSEVAAVSRPRAGAKP